MNGSYDSCNILKQPNGEVTVLKYYTQYRVRVARVNVGGFTGPFSNEAVNFTTTECCESTLTCSDINIINKLL